MKDKKIIVSFVNSLNKLGIQSKKLYCNKTFVKLIPSYLKDLAYAYKNGKYNTTIDRICASENYIPVITGFIDKIVNGINIKKIEYSTDEGYDETGFKSIMRSFRERYGRRYC